MRFTCTIRLGNAAMLTHGDVAEALQNLVYKLQRGAVDDGVILDANGNGVGEWSISEPRTLRATRRRSRA